MKPLNRHQGAESHTQRNLWGSALGQRLPALSVVKEPVVAEMLNHSSQHLPQQTVETRMDRMIINLICSILCICAHVYTYNYILYHDIHIIIYTQYCNM